MAAAPASPAVSTPGPLSPSTALRGPLRRFGAGLDIGGTLTKLAYFELAPRADEPPADTAFRAQMRELIASPEAYGETGVRDAALEFESAILGGKIYLLNFETRRMDGFLETVRAAGVVGPDTIICCTGGGARKFRGAIREVLKVELPHHDELQCLVDGINIVLQHPVPALYTVNHETYRSAVETEAGG